MYILGSDTLLTYTQLHLSSILLYTAAETKLSVLTLLKCLGGLKMVTLPYTDCIYNYLLALESEFRAGDMAWW
jgi:hypothetical protein